MTALFALGRRWGRGFCDGQLIAHGFDAGFHSGEDGGHFARSFGIDLAAQDDDVAIHFDFNVLELGLAREF
ncbi:MAG TPA: hypothetical protein VGH74_04185 [Planctomycetaceae bacterium]